MVLKCYEKLKPNLFTHAEDIDMNVYIYKAGTGGRAHKLLALRGRTHVSWVDRVVHDGDPALESGRLEEADVGVANVVKVDRRVVPLRVVLVEAGPHVGHHLVAHADLGLRILTLNTNNSNSQSRPAEIQFD